MHKNFVFDFDNAITEFFSKKTKASAAGIKTDCLTKYVGYNDSV